MGQMCYFDLLNVLCSERYIRCLRGMRGHFMKSVRFSKPWRGQSINNRMNYSLERNKSKNFFLQFAFGGSAALVSKTVASPIEVVKLRLQVQQVLLDQGHITHHYEGIMDCLRRLYKENGLASYFKGNATNALRFFLTQALNFSFRDLFRNLQSQKSGKRKENLSFSSNIVSGGAAGASTQLVVYPLDYARTRLANQVQKSKSFHFNGLTDCLFKTYKSDGLLGLYRGFTVSCMCMVIYRGLNFGIYDSLRPYIPREREENMLLTFGLGYVATIISGACSYPLDTVRRRMMMTSGENVKINSTLGCMKKIYGEGGWKSFFKGGAANVVGGLTGAAVFSVYDRIKVYYQNKFTE